MMSRFAFVVCLLSLPAAADETRQLDSHEHGVGALNIAFDGSVVAMELRAPGADIVGFEHAAESAADRAAIDAAVAKLARPLSLFGLPDKAECNVTQARAALEAEENHGDHDHEAHEDHEDHKDHDHDEAHADEHAHDDDKASEAHTEFHAEYTLSCGNPNALTSISFAYFDVFPNSRVLDVQIVSNKGAQAFEIERADPRLDLRGMF